MSAKKLINASYYAVKPLLPRRLQIWLRTQVINQQRKAVADIWPILERAGEPPEDWAGWPQGKQFAFVSTHDVELDRGQQRCPTLAGLEKELGFRSSFNFVPERYQVSPQLRSYLQEEGFEVGVHGLNHDGRLFQTRAIFAERAPRIRKYLKEWGAVGFRSPSMHHNLDWIHELNLEYDLSTFDTDPFEPQPSGVETVFPFWVQGSNGNAGYMELPYTLVQDFTAFILMREKSIDVWRTKLDWIAEKGRMALVNTHPDYMSMGGATPSIEEYPVERYLELLDYLNTAYKGSFHNPLPMEVARYCSPLRHTRHKTATGR